MWGDEDIQSTTSLIVGLTKNASTEQMDDKITLLEQTNSLPRLRTLWRFNAYIPRLKDGGEINWIRII